TANTMITPPTAPAVTPLTPGNCDSRPAPPPLIKAPPMAAKMPSRVSSAPKMIITTPAAVTMPGRDGAAADEGGAAYWGAAYWGGGADGGSGAGADAGVWSSGGGMLVISGSLRTCLARVQPICRGRAGSLRARMAG